MKKINRGHYETEVRCKCGGIVRIERVDVGEFAWEAYCAACEKADPNGWPTLKEAAKEANVFFSPLATKGAQ